MPDDGETDSETAVDAGRGAVGLLKAIEDGGEELGGDSLPGVRHADLELRPGSIEAHLDLSLQGGELDRIGDEVPDDLLEPVRICDQLIVTGRRAASKEDLDLLRLGRRAHRVERGLDDGGEVRRANREPQLSSDDPGNVQEIVDQLRLRQHVALDDLEAPGRSRRVRVTGPQRAGP